MSGPCGSEPHPVHYSIALVAKVTRAFFGLQHESAALLEISSSQSHIFMYAADVSSLRLAIDPRATAMSVRGRPFYKLQAQQFLAACLEVAQSITIEH